MLVLYPYPRLDSEAVRDFVALTLSCNVEIWDHSQGRMPDWSDSMIEVKERLAADISIYCDLPDRSEAACSLLKAIALHFGCWLATPDLPLHSECRWGGMFGLVSPTGDYFEAHEINVSSDDDDVSQELEAEHSDEWFIDWTTLQPLGTCAARNHDPESF